ncbi:MAG: family 20 glycosylhydrolase [Lewinellaceae bacterium]|nr:family 20 glycosylhydrolase [Lewinellaceae bacterium]
MKKLLSLLFLILSFLSLSAQEPAVIDTLPIRGFCIAAPEASGVDAFVAFIEKELAPRRVNTLVLRVDYNYQYTSHPELRNEGALSQADIKKIVKACRQNAINLIPQINLLGHQSWHSELENLLKVYPQFDETPKIQLPENYVWPNADGLYCKSYCPLHPDLHDVVFALVDELMEVCEAKAFHAGMDEVFYIGDEDCPRCGGRDKAELFAGEVRTINNHLLQKGWRLWIWGDRLLDGKTTGLGMWEASMNNTHRAIDLIPRSVIICDWHYDRAEPTAAYFALKGFQVVTCPWNKADVAVGQVQDYKHFKQHANPGLAYRYRGLMHTIWVPAGVFLDAYYGRTTLSGRNQGQVECFKALFDAME